MADPTPVHPDVFAAAEALARECPLRHTPENHLGYHVHYLCKRNGRVLCCFCDSRWVNAGEGYTRSARQQELDAAKRRVRKEARSGEGAE